MTFEQHCQHCQEVLGERFEYVHLWLDEFWVSMGPRHRKMRHNNDGIKEVYKKWGEAAAKAAELHIRDDGEYCKKVGDLWLPEAGDPFAEEKGGDHVS
jgi:hypothetical protein